jgi:hypothetical protein
MIFKPASFENQNETKREAVNTRRILDCCVTIFPRNDSGQASGD